VVDVTSVRGSGGPSGAPPRPRDRRSRKGATVHQITSARRGIRDDVDSRTRRYLISMGVRTLCFVGAVVVGDGWLRWVLIVGALVLPYVSVVFANGGRERVVDLPDSGQLDDHRAITGPDRPA
jgi:hypothetical protein